MNILLIQSPILSLIPRHGNMREQSSSSQRPPYHDIDRKKSDKNQKRKGGGRGKKRWCHAIDTRKKLGYILDYWCDGDNANKNLI